MTFPSLTLIDPQSPDDIRGIIINESPTNIWAMLVTFGDNTPKAVASINITQSDDTGVQKIDCRYCQIKDPDPINTSYNKYMYKTASEEDNLEYDEKSMYVLPIEGDEEMKLALMIFTDGNHNSIYKLLSEVSGGLYSSFYSMYNTAFSVDNGITTAKSKDAISVYETIVARYMPGILTDYFTIDHSNIREFENYRPILYNYLLKELGKKAKIMSSQHKKESTLPSKLGGLAGLATGLFGAITGGALQTVDQNVIEKVSKGVEGIFTRDKKEDKKEPLLKETKTRDLLSRL